MSGKGKGGRGLGKGQPLNVYTEVEDIHDFEEIEQHGSNIPKTPTLRESSVEDLKALLVRAKQTKNKTLVSELEKILNNQESHEVDTLEDFVEKYGGLVEREEGLQTITYVNISQDEMDTDMVCQLMALGIVKVNGRDNQSIFRFTRWLKFKMVNGVYQLPLQSNCKVTIRKGMRGNIDYYVKHDNEVCLIINYSKTENKYFVMYASPVTKKIKAIKSSHYNKPYFIYMYCNPSFQYSFRKRLQRSSPGTSL
jgi:hypothetical protein